MPRYSLLDKDTEEEYEVEMSMEELEDLLKNNKHLQQIFRPILIAYRMNQYKNLDPGFKARLKKIKKESPGSKMETFD